MPVFILLARDNNGEFHDGYWWKVLYVDKASHLSVGDSYTAENRYGGKSSYNVVEKGDIIVDADDWKDLDWTACLLRSDSKYGYIDPQGKWYGCNYSDHLDLCELVIRQDNPEEHGWVKVYKSSFRDPDYYSRRKFLTEEQKKTLYDIGFADIYEETS